MRATMRGFAFVVLMTTLGLAQPVCAQNVLDGPLSAETPKTQAPTPAAGKTVKRTKPKTVRHAKAPAASPGSEAPQPEIPVARKGVDENPLSLGMKWNGSNDNGSQTRVQNYGGDAAGTGAAVGLKLHF